MTPRRSPARRLAGVDAARGLALVGMIAVHITPSVAADGDYSIIHLLAGGRSSALFAVLAGVGLALASGGDNRPRGPALRRAWAGVVVRAALLVVVGALIGAGGSGVAVILVYYGALFLLALPFLSLPARVLLPLAACWAVTMPVVSHALRLDAPPRLSGNITFESFTDPGGLVWQLALTGYYPVLPWLAYILAGLGIGRLALGSIRVATRVMVAGAALAVIAYLTSWVMLRQGVMERLIEAGTGIHPTSRPFTDGVLNTSFYGTTPTTSAWWLTVASPHTATPFDLLHTIGTSAAILGLMLLAAHRFAEVLSPLAAIGSMTFTLYTLHVLLLASLLPRELEYATLIHIMVAFAVAVPWRGSIGRGPLEALAAALGRSARAVVVPRRE